MTGILKKDFFSKANNEKESNFMPVYSTNIIIELVNRCKQA